MAESPQSGQDYSVSEYSYQPTELDVEMEMSRLSTSTAESIDYSLLTCIDQSQIETSKNFNQLEINQKQNVDETKSASELSLKTCLSRFENESSSEDQSEAERMRIYQEWSSRNAANAIGMDESSILQNLRNAQAGFTTEDEDDESEYVIRNAQAGFTTEDEDDESEYVISELGEYSDSHHVDSLSDGSYMETSTGPRILSINIPGNLTPKAVDACKTIETAAVLLEDAREVYIDMPQEPQGLFGR
uniref:Uncharacterized protein n=1 Tax=Panagrolaimus sp. JU765 TaxID=591449 RepID=A0AC34Q9W7_9BILA